MVSHWKNSCAKNMDRVNCRYTTYARTTASYHRLLLATRDSATHLFFYSNHSTFCCFIVVFIQRMVHDIAISGLSNRQSSRSFSPSASMVMATSLVIT